MQPHTAKQEALEAIQRLPDSVALEEIVYRLYVLNKIQQGMLDVDAGHTLTSKELLQAVEQW